MLCFSSCTKSRWNQHHQGSQVQKDDVLSGKNIVITGGSSGIGLAIAKKSIEAGAKVVITGRNEEKLKQTVSDLGSQHAGYVLWDITDSAQADDKVAQCVDYFGGRVDAVVNNAGIQPHEFFPNVSVAEWNRVYGELIVKVRSLFTMLSANIGCRLLQAVIGILSISLRKEDSSELHIRIVCPNGIYED